MSIFKKKQVSETLEKASGPFQWIWRRWQEAVIGMFSLLVIVFSIISYYPEVGKTASELISGNKYIALVDGFFNPFRNRNALLDAGLPIYDLRIRREEYAKLENIAKEAVAKGWMSDDLKIWVDASFFHEGQKVFLSCTINKETLLYFAFN